jgi:myo-inositol-1(or 4)-monophosphatase
VNTLSSGSCCSEGFGSPLDALNESRLNTYMASPSIQALLETAISAARTAGLYALHEAHRAHEYHSVLPHDLKLVLDKESQEVAENIIFSEFPSHAICGEEGSTPPQTSSWEWIIDPIDGTVNFAHGSSYWCSSVAIRHQDTLLAGAVYAPVLDHLYAASIEHPSSLNNSPIHPSSVQEIQQAMVYTGMSKQLHMDEPAAVHRLTQLSITAQKIRMNGSAALDICQVASGVADAYLESGIYLWDYAAAGLIAEQAGALLHTQTLPNTDDATAVLCSAPGITNALLPFYIEGIPHE